MSASTISPVVRRYTAEVNASVSGPSSAGQSSARNTTRFSMSGLALWRFVDRPLTSPPSTKTARVHPPARLQARSEVRNARRASDGSTPGAELEARLIVIVGCSQKSGVPSGTSSTVERW